MSCARGGATGSTCLQRTTRSKTSRQLHVAVVASSRRRCSCSCTNCAAWMAACSAFELTLRRSRSAGTETHSRAVGRWDGRVGRGAAGTHQPSHELLPLVGEEPGAVVLSKSHTRVVAVSPSTTPRDRERAEGSKRGRCACAREPTCSSGPISPAAFSSCFTAGFCSVGDVRGGEPHAAAASVTPAWSSAGSGGGGVYPVPAGTHASTHTHTRTRTADCVGAFHPCVRTTAPRRTESSHAAEEVFGCSAY